MYEPHVYVVIGLQAGSEGKGKVSLELAYEHDAKVAISNNMPNAGHTVVKDNNKYVFSVFPSSSVKDDTVIFLGSGTAIDEGILEEEYDRYKELFKGREIYASPLIPIIEERHKNYEKEVLKSGSTFKGCGAVLSEKVMRNPNLKYFKGFRNIKVVDNFKEILLAHLKTKKAILEVAQGCDLSLLHNIHYPHVTSRPVSVTQALTETGISYRWVKEVTGVIRPYPIRISNNAVTGEYIYTGDFGNTKETEWIKIEIASERGWIVEMVEESDVLEYIEIWNIYQETPMTREEINNALAEFTTVTKKPRRTFPIDLDLLKQNCIDNNVDNIYMNFVQYWDKSFEGQTGNNGLDLDFYQERHLEGTEDYIGVPITRFGTGKENGQYIHTKK